MARVEFVLPDVGEGLEEGEIVSWLVAAGDTVARDQPLVEVQTDKALVELPSPVAGQVVVPGLRSRRHREGRPGPRRPGGRPGRRPAAASPRASPRRPAPAAPAAGPAAGPPRGHGRPKAAPAVRKLALDRGVDLATVTGTGPGGRILAADVEAAADGLIRATWGGNTLGTRRLDRRS